IVVAVMGTILGMTTGASGQCNNLTRSLQHPAGSSSNTSSCPVMTVSVSILGQSATLTTPASCPNNKTTYFGSIYSCGPSATDIHCTAKGFKVRVMVWDIGSGSPCPQGGNVFSSWAAARAAFNCAPLPLVSDTYDWSATVKNCPHGSTTGDGHAH